jgi:hypothetical protein
MAGQEAGQQPQRLGGLPAVGHLGTGVGHRASAINTLAAE